MKAVFCIVLLALATVAIAENSSEENTDKCKEVKDAMIDAARTCHVKKRDASALMGQTAINAILRRKRNINRPSRDAGSADKTAEFLSCFEDKIQPTTVYKIANELCKDEKDSDRHKCMHEEICKQCEDLKICSKQNGGAGGFRTSQ